MKQSASAFIFNRLSVGVLVACLVSQASLKGAALAELVDPRVGCAPNQGSTVIGPTLPHGSIHPSPDTVDGGHAGYQSGHPIRGFSQLHASGTGWGRYGNLLISPQIGLSLATDGHDSPASDEKAEAFGYRVRLTRYAVLAEIAPTRHAAIYRFTFPASDDANLMIDLAHQIPGEIATVIKDGKVSDSVITLDPKQRSFSGSSHYEGGFGHGSYTVYFYAELDTTPKAFGTWKNQRAVPDAVAERWSKVGDRIGGWWRYATKADQVVQLKIGVSFRSVEQAREYLRQEIPDWNFAAVRTAARQAWDNALGSIEVAGGSETQRIQFYTALYHAQIMPRDRTGEFVRFPADASMWDDQYAVWDTWRTKYPLMLWIQPEMVRGAISSFVDRLHVDGQIRDTFTSGWAGKNCERDQGGNDVDNIIADAYVKGLRGVNWAKAYELLKSDAEHERQGNSLAGGNDYRRQGWISAGIMSVSSTLEYAYNDFVTAQVAQGLGHQADANRYFTRARQWQHLFNPAAESEGYNGFIMPRTQDGVWCTNCDPKKYPGSWGMYFYEASSWTYSYFAPHQIGRLVELMGGKERFAERLEYAHKKNLIQFDNEPGFLAPFLFHYAGRPDMSSEWMRRFVRERYSLTGYPGDDDSGAMSSFYVWASMGIFPNAGQNIYFLNGPLFDRVVVKRPEEGRLEISRTGTGDYVASVTLNGKPLDRSWIRHREIKGDTVIAFAMSESPSRWGTQQPPPSDETVAASAP